MIKITQVVEDLIGQNELALEALRAGMLNLSAYSEQIKPIIESKLFKPVKKGSIVTALSRIASNMDKLLPLRASVQIEDMSIKSPLCEITYEKTKEVSKSIQNLGTKYFSKGFFTSTQGTSEITLIVSNTIKNEVKDFIGIKPKAEYDNLSAMTVRFNEQEYIEIPNMIYTLVSVLAHKRINIIEVVSTFTEISFIVRQSDLKMTVDVLKDNFLK